MPNVSPDLCGQECAVALTSTLSTMAPESRCLLLTGLPCSGKTTLALALEQHLSESGCEAFVLDGDKIRKGLNKDLGFTLEDRSESIRRVAEVARLMVEAGLIVIVAHIAPFRKDREMARSLFEAGQFIEVFLDTPLQVCEQRDVKGFYALARQGRLQDFTGIDSPYEEPLSPEVRIDTSFPLDECVEKVLASLVWHSEPVVTEL
jgi:adenylyl-sulfate kinase